MKTPKKIVCVCAGGNVRSVGTAWTLKYGFGCNAVAVSLEKNTPEPLGMLAKWADRITVAQPEMAAEIPAEFKDKIRVVDVGPDVYGQADHPELQKAIVLGLKESGLIQEII